MSTDAAPTESILFVDDTPEVLDVCLRLFEHEYRIVVARSGEEGLEACRMRGPFSVVVSDYEMHGTRGGEFLARVQEAWPDTVTMLLTGVVEVDVAIEALHAGRIFRFLEKPCPREVLAAALRDGIEENRRRRTQRALTVQLDFTRECLEQFNGELENRICEQTRQLVRLHQFVDLLNSLETVQQVASATVEAASDLCESRAARVAIAQRADGAEAVDVTYGVFSGNVHYQDILGDEGVLGSVQIAEHGRPLTQSQRSVVASLAASAAVAARNAIRRRERDAAQQATILALAKLAEQRDNETGKHLERVSEFCRLIAGGLREDGWYREALSDEWIAMLSQSAPLHDIGKVGIPDSILLKPGKLTPDEWTIMKRHTEIGADTLRSVMVASSDQAFLRMSLDIAWCHHEKWDGGGYPRALLAEEIPLSARIVALADVYDALTSERPYKHAWTHDEALSWILQGSGAHFDPRVVDAFVKRADQADRIRQRLADTPEDIARAGPLLRLSSGAH